MCSTFLEHICFCIREKVWEATCSVAGCMTHKSIEQKTSIHSLSSHFVKENEQCFGFSWLGTGGVISKEQVRQKKKKNKNCARFMTLRINVWKARHHKGLCHSDKGSKQAKL